MPISPTVSAYMQGGQEGQGQPMDADTLFKNSLQEQAFSTLRAKAPALIPYVVTFKCLEANVDTGCALGAFAVTCGSDLVFVPVVMHAGSIISCEILYMRDEDQFVPLNENYIKEILNRNTAQIARPMQGNVRVEDTRRLFRNLIRPPASSNVVLASGRLDISELPNEAKAKVVSYFNDNPEVLAKIAEFYPVRLLAERLSQTAEKTAGADAVPRVLSVTDIDSTEAAYLHPEEKRAMLERGWVLKGCVPETKIAFDVADFGAETEAELSEYGRQDAASGAVYTGNVLLYRNGAFDWKPVIVFGCSDSERECGSFYAVSAAGDSVRVSGTACNHAEGRIVLSNKRIAAKADLLSFGFTDVSGLRDQIRRLRGTPGDASYRCFVVVPRKGGYLSHALNLYMDDDTAIAEMDDNTWQIFREHGEHVTVTPKLTYGCVKVKTETWLSKCSNVPTTALFRVVRTNSAAEKPFYGLVNTLQQMFEIVRCTGIDITVQRRNGSIDITNRTTQKTASFRSEAEAAAHLHSEYSLTEDQIADTLNRSDTLILSKYAAGVLGGQPVPGLQQPAPAPAPMPIQQTPQILPQGNVQVPAFDPSAMPAFAATQDPDMVDVGILSSFAGDPDIKALLVDYLPDFKIVMDRLGRVILLFCVQKDELEQYYRADHINELLQNCRKIFKLVGDLVQSLKVYINMA